MNISVARILQTGVGVLEEVTDQIRLVASLPATIALANDALARFAQTIDALDVLVRRLDRLAESVAEPVDQLAPRLDALLPLLDSPALRAVPEMLDAVSRDALPALAAVSETQQQVASMATSIERLVAGLEDTVGRLQELPGAGLITRRLAARTRD